MLGRLLKTSAWKTTFLLKWPLFRWHVSFRGSRSKKYERFVEWEIYSLCFVRASMSSMIFLPALGEQRRVKVARGAPRDAGQGILASWSMWSMEVYIPSSTFSKRKCIFKWWIAMLVYRRVSKTHLFMHSSASTVGFVAQTRKARNSEAVKHLQFKDNTSKIEYFHLDDQWRWMIDVYHDISSI